MVSKAPRTMMTRRSNSDLKNKRPKRNISPKNLDDLVSGLSWREERELKKALYASLQEARRQSRDDKPEDEDYSFHGDSKPGMFHSQSRTSLSSMGDSKFMDESSCSVDSFVESKGTTRQETKKTKFHAQRKFAANTFTPIQTEPLSLGAQDSKILSLNHQKKIHAQRKFAAGGSSPSTSVETPTKPKLKATPVKLFPVRPKTEDFLTYLCFRGTSVLPPHMDLMNVQKEESHENGLTNGRTGFTRESSPASSSSISHQNEDSMDVPDFSMKPQTPNRKAARASASTPQTARGFANLSRNSKKSPNSKLTPASRKRLSDSYTASGKVKGHMTDRLTLKRKAMATLTAKRNSPKKKEMVRKLKTSVSDGVLVKRKEEKEDMAVSKSVCRSMPANNSTSVPEMRNDRLPNTTTPVSGTSLLHNTGVSPAMVSVLPDNISIAPHQTTVLPNESSCTPDHVFISPESSTVNELSDRSVIMQDEQTVERSGVVWAEDGIIEDKKSGTTETGTDLTLEDSGVCFPLNDSQVCDKAFQLPLMADQVHRDKNNLCEVDSPAVGERTPDPVEVLRSRESNGDQNALISTLFPPLESDLDESLDVAMELDVSLSESFDVTEVFNEVTADDLALDTPRTFHSEGLGKDWDQCKAGSDNGLNTEIGSKSKPQCRKDRGFKSSFTIISDVKLKRKRQISGAHGRCPVTRSMSLSIADHSYSKTITEVKFTVKPSKVVQSMSFTKSVPASSGTKQRKLTCGTSDVDWVTHRQDQRSVKPFSVAKSTTQSSRQSTRDIAGTKFRKRKSTSDLRDTASPPKKQKLRTSQRVKTLLKTAEKCPDRTKNRSKYFASLETHPVKRLATNPTVSSKVKKTFKPHRPMTRAASHVKSALKAAKLAANKKLRLISRAVPSKKESSTPGNVENKRRSLPSPEKKKKLSLESTESKSSFGSNDSGEIRIKTERFPEDSQAPGIVQCPTYYPSEEQFKDPILYIQSIQSEAEQYGMCKIVPPCSWKMESREMADFRFTTQIQYVHKMLHKWSPITEQLEYIKKLHQNSGHEDIQVPQIGGVEIDLVKLYELVQKYGGMKGTVGKEKKWMKIADGMCIPKQADRVSKLYAAYCKYLLPYETLSDEETKKLAESVETERVRLEKNKSKTLPPYYRCVHKGRSQLLSAYNRAARNTQQLYGEDGKLTPDQIEAKYWEIVRKSDDHISAQGASLDTSIYGSMFPVRRDNQYARHGWNLHNFVESKGSILHHLGLIAGVTVPTLHISMMFSSKCFSCNSHNLPTVQYLHQGDGIVWYAVPGHEKASLKSALKKLIPQYTRDHGFSLQHDTVMVPPSQLVGKGVSLSRCVQTAREFVVVFPSVTYSNVSLGHNLSESVHYGTQDWIPDGYRAAQALGINHDIELFSMDALLVFLARDQTTPDTTLALLLPHLEKVVEREVMERKALADMGLKETERLQDKVAKPSQKADLLEEIIICDVSNKICYLSMVLNSHENSAFSLEQGLLHLQKRKNLKHCKLMYRYSEEELKSLLRDVKNRLRGSNSSSPATASPKRKTRKSVSETKSSPASSTASK